MATIKAYTDLEQSHKLAEILPIESADMCYREYREEGGIPDYAVTLCPYRFADWIGVPCWSLSALLGVMPKGEDKDLSLVFGSYDGGYHPLWFCTYEEVPMILEICSADNPIDACVEMIYKLKEKDLL